MVPVVKSLMQVISKPFETGRHTTQVCGTVVEHVVLLCNNIVIEASKSVFNIKCTQKHQ